MTSELELLELTVRKHINNIAIILYPLLLFPFDSLSVHQQQVLKCRHHAPVAVKAARNTTAAQNVDHDFSSSWKEMTSVRQGYALPLVLLDIMAFEIGM